MPPEVSRKYPCRQPYFCLRLVAASSWVHEQLPIVSVASPGDDPLDGTGVDWKPVNGLPPAREPGPAAARGKGMGCGAIEIVGAGDGLGVDGRGCRNGAGDGLRVPPENRGPGCKRGAGRPTGPIANGFGIGPPPIGGKSSGGGGRARVGAGRSPKMVSSGGSVNSGGGGSSKGGNSGTGNTEAKGPAAGSIVVSLELVALGRKNPANSAVRGLIARAASGSVAIVSATAPTSPAMSRAKSESTIACPSFDG